MSDAPAAPIAITLTPTTQGDLEHLVALRIDAMRPSLERIGRFDPVRARERFQATYDTALTRHIVLDGERIGFVVVRQETSELLLDHLYIAPGYQGRGLGAAVLSHVFEQADRCGLPVRVGALRESASNRFYLQHGFQQTGESEWDIYYLRPASTQAASHIQATSPA